MGVVGLMTVDFSCVALATGLMGLLLILVSIIGSWLYFYRLRVVLFVDLDVVVAQLSMRSAQNTMGTKSTPE